MVRVGCAGFSIPQSRYFQEFMLLEVQETALRVPGPGTVSRWEREAPEGFAWTLLAPMAVTTGGPESAAFVRISKTLHADAGVLVPGAAASGRAGRAAVRKWVEKLPRGLRWVVEPPPDWSAADRKSLASEEKVVVAVDPLAAPPPPGPVAYFRLPGPAGHRSRYEDSALHEVWAIARGFPEVWAIFTNADMHTDAKRFEKIAS